MAEASRHVEQGDSQQVGGTSGEGFVSSPGRPDAQDGDEDVCMWGDGQEHSRGKRPIEGDEQKLMGVAIRTGELQQGVGVTEVMVDDTGATERQAQQAARLG